VTLRDSFYFVFALFFCFLLCFIFVFALFWLCFGFDLSFMSLLSKMMLGVRGGAEEKGEEERKKITQMSPPNF
jgi:predicted membrane protein